MSPCRITRYSAKTRVRVLHQEVDRRFFDRVLKQAQEHLLDEPFAVDGTLSEAWASQKKDGGDDAPQALEETPAGLQPGCG